MNIHHDNWIPRQGCLQPLGAEYVNGVTKVGDLLDHTGTSWDHHKVDAMFTSDDACDIKQIAVGGPGVQDYIAWNYTKNGLFSVKSAYHLRMAMNQVKSGRPESSSSVNKHKGWLALWATSAPGKAKIHMWRLIRNGLAVGAELHRRRIKPGLFCTACGHEETIVHRFWDCPHSVCFWKKLRSEMGISVAIPPCNTDSQSKLASWLLGWFADATEEERSMMVQAVYGLWLARNEARDGRKIAEPHEIMQSVLAYVKEWDEIHAREAKTSNPRSSRCGRHRMMETR